MKTSRIPWVDQTRGVAVLLIVAGHLGIPGEARMYLYAFHIPLFFMLSGMLWKEKPWTVYLSSKAKTRLIPYAIFSVITYAWWLVAPNALAHWWQPLLGIAYGIGIAPWMVHNPPLWFFPCLFAMEIFFYFVRGIWNIIGLAIAGYVLLKFSGLRLPWGIELAMIALPFFWLGQRLGTDWTIPTWWPAFIPVFALTAWLNGMIDLNYGSIHIPPLYYVAAVSGSLAVLCAVRLVSMRWMTWAGQRTVPIVGLHAPISWLG
jgi:acyltransferase